MNEKSQASPEQITMDVNIPGIAIPDSDGLPGLDRSTIQKMPSSMTIGLDDEEPV